MEMFIDKMTVTGNSGLTKREQLREEYIHRLQKDVNNLNETVESEIKMRKGKEKKLLSKQIECLHHESDKNSLNTRLSAKSKENDELKKKLKRMEERVNFLEKLKLHTSVGFEKENTAILEKEKLRLHELVRSEKENTAILEKEKLRLNELVRSEKENTAILEKEKLRLHELVRSGKENTAILEKRFHDLEMQHKGMVEDYKEQQETMTTIMGMSKKFHSKVRNKTIDCLENARKDKDVAMSEFLLNKRQEIESKKCLTSEDNGKSKIKRLQMMFENHEENQQSPPDENTKRAAITVVNAQYFINKT